MEGDSSCHLFTKDCRDLNTKSTSPGWKLTPLEDNPKPKAAIQELDVKVIRSLCEVYNYVSFVSHVFFVKCPLARKMSTVGMFSLYSTITLLWLVMVYYFVWDGKQCQGSVWRRQFAGTIYVLPGPPKPKCSTPSILIVLTPFKHFSNASTLLVQVRPPPNCFFITWPASEWKYDHLCSPSTLESSNATAPF